jgi:hypothetical protein
MSAELKAVHDQITQQQQAISAAVAAHKRGELSERGRLATIKAQEALNEREHRAV